VAAVAATAGARQQPPQLRRACWLRLRQAPAAFGGGVAGVSGAGGGRTGRVGGGGGGEAGGGNQAGAGAGAAVGRRHHVRRQLPRRNTVPANGGGCGGPAPRSDGRCRLRACSGGGGRPRPRAVAARPG